jgi:dihydroorotase
MIDFWPRPERPYQDLLLHHLRPGDIHTHMYAAQFPLLDEAGQVQEFMHEARRRGVVFDVGHGAGSFWFRRAVPAIEQGFVPDSISTDMHQNTILIPQATMPLTMSKLLNIGMPLPDVIRRSTLHPAQEIGRPDLGTLSPGAGADVAVFQVEEGDFGFVDSGRARMSGTQRLRCTMTLRAGEVVWDLNGLAWTDWREAGNYGLLDPYGEERSSPLLRQLLQWSPTDTRRAGMRNSSALRQGAAAGRSLGAQIHNPTRCGEREAGLGCGTVARRPPARS